MSRVLLGLVLAVTLSAVAAGCSRAEDGPRATVTANGFTRYEVGSTGFSVAVPDSWITFEPTDVDPEAADEFIRDNPVFEAYGDLYGPRSPIEFFAIDPARAPNGFTTTVTVVVLPAPDGFTLDELARSARGEVERVGGEEIEDERVTLAGGEAYVISYRLPFTHAGRSMTVAGRQYELIAGGRIFSLTYTTVPAIVDRYDETFTRSAVSFRAG